MRIRNIKELLKGNGEEEKGGDPQFHPKLKNYWPLLVSGGRGDSFLQEYCP